MKIIYFSVIFILISSFPGFSQNNFRLGVNLDNAGAFINIINQTNRISVNQNITCVSYSTFETDSGLIDFLMFAIILIVGAFKFHPL